MARARGLVLTGSAVAALVCTSCIQIDLPSGESLFPAASFIVGGVMEVDTRGPECSLFHGDNGFEYHLFQGPRLTNEEYDQLFESGARSRLEIQVRTDLDLRCRRARVAEVIEVLEFIPAAEVE